MDAIDENFIKQEIRTSINKRGKIPTSNLCKINLQIPELFRQERSRERLLPSHRSHRKLRRAADGEVENRRRRRRSRFMGGQKLERPNFINELRQAIRNDVVALILTLFLER